MNAENKMVIFTMKILLNWSVNVSWRFLILMDTKAEMLSLSKADIAWCFDDDYFEIDVWRISTVIL